MSERAAGLSGSPGIGRYAPPVEPTEQPQPLAVVVTPHTPLPPGHPPTIPAKRNLPAGQDGPDSKGGYAELRARQIELLDRAGSAPVLPVRGADPDDAAFSMRWAVGQELLATRNDGKYGVAFDPFQCAIAVGLQIGGEGREDDDLTAVVTAASKALPGPGSAPGDHGITFPEFINALAHATDADSGQGRPDVARNFFALVLSALDDAHKSLAMIDALTAQVSAAFNVDPGGLKADGGAANGASPGRKEPLSGLRPGLRTVILANSRSHGLDPNDLQAARRHLRSTHPPAGASLAPPSGMGGSPPAPSLPDLASPLHPVQEDQRRSPPVPGPEKPKALAHRAPKVVDGPGEQPGTNPTLLAAIKGLRKVGQTVIDGKQVDIWGGQHPRDRSAPAALNPSDSAASSASAASATDAKAAPHPDPAKAPGGASASASSPASAEGGKVASAPGENKSSAVGTGKRVRIGW